MNSERCFYLLCKTVQGKHSYFSALDLEKTDQPTHQKNVLPTSAELALK